MHAPERIPFASRTQLSIARYYGGCKLNGHEYVYDADADTLIRADVLKAEERAAIERKRAERLRKKLERERQQPALPGMSA